MKFLTESGSLYELDREQSAIRRLYGPTPPTTRQGRDGEFKAFVHCNEPELGRTVLVCWGDGPEATETSPVVEIIE